MLYRLLMMSECVKWTMLYRLLMMSECVNGQGYIDC